MAKVIFAVPPIKSEKGFAQATQNRQAQYFKDPTYIYPVIPAVFVTMLVQEPNHEVLWIDSVAEGLSEVEFGQVIIDMKPDFIVFEANTMLINRYYEIINGLKANIPDMKIILTGEHCTAFPLEAKDKCKADYILKGGKWYHEAFRLITGKEWGEDKLLPQINRDISRWWLYAYKNGNFKHVPATYTMFAQDCWYRPKQPCTFCTWVDYHPVNKIRPIEDCLDEVEALINKGFKEFFDDSGTFPVGKWLKAFCDGMIERGYNKYIVWGCNMRFGALSEEEFKLMAKAGCRFILWGFESANQSTLDRLHKGTDIKQIPKDLMLSWKHGIWNHLTVMFGYPWETLEEEKRTYTMTRWLLLNDWASSAQATICMPYPGTALYKEMDEAGLLLTKDWNEWDMTRPVMKLQYDFNEILKFQKGVYDISYHPRFIWNKLKRIRSIDDFKFYFRLSKKVFDRFGNIVDSGKVAIDG